MSNNPDLDKVVAAGEKFVDELGHLDGLLRVGVFESIGQGYMIVAHVRSKDCDAVEIISQMKKFQGYFLVIQVGTLANKPY